MSIFLFGNSNQQKEDNERILTKASLNSLEKALLDFGYEVNRTSMAISATYGGTWKTNGHISTLTINDFIEYRECVNKETSQGYLCNPKKGRLAKIIAKAEELDSQNNN